MTQTFNKIISGDHQYKIGVYFGIAIVLVSLANNVKIWILEINSPFDWLFVFLIGITIFFFFMGIGMNTEENIFINEKLLENGIVNRQKSSYSTTHLRHFNILSKSCFWFFGIFLFLSFIRLGFIIWK